MPGAWSAPSTWTPGQIVTDVQLNAQVRDNLLWLGGTVGTPVTFTPIVLQSTQLTLNTATGYYFVIGKLVFASVDINIGSAGSAGSPILLSALPAVPQQRGAACFGWYLRTGIGYTALVGAWVSATQIKFYNGVSAVDALGANPSFATANNDILHATLWYEGT